MKRAPAMVVAAACAAIAGAAALAPDGYAAQTPPAAKAAPPAKAPAAGNVPTITIDTVKGTIVIETFPLEAPRSVEHIVKLVKRRFYDGQSIHRVVPGQLVQFGDQQSRNATLKEWWGRGPNSGSGNPIGVAEFSKKRLHKRGSVSLANNGAAASADSQLFFALRASPQWDGKYTVIGQITAGIDIPAKLQVGDRIRKVTVSP
jgi:cyclophilin family peptidyl-prolyl cis-trans isomerase